MQSILSKYKVIVCGILILTAVTLYVTILTKIKERMDIAQLSPENGNTRGTDIFTKSQNEEFVVVPTG